MRGTLNEESILPGPEHVREALAIPNFDHVAAWQKMVPQRRRLYPTQHIQDPTPAAVLLLLFPREEEWRFVLTRRSENLRGHSGQISFPGGRIEAEDANARAAALRETQEELGIRTGEVVFLGELSTVYITPTHFNVQTPVGMLRYEPTWRPNPQEVAEVFSMSLVELLDSNEKEEFMAAGARKGSMGTLLRGARPPGLGGDCLDS